MWLAGVQRPDFHITSDFRKDNIEMLRRLFKQVVQICQKLGMVSVGLVAIDGTNSLFTNSLAPYERSLP